MTSITIIGGTGFAGSHIAREAVSRGYRVTSLSRKQPTAPVEGVTYVVGSASSPDDLASVITGADVVIGALSPRAGSENTMAQTYRVIAEQAASAGARLLVIGGFGSLRPETGAPRFVEGDGMPPEVIAEAREMNSVLSQFEAEASEGLDWVFISPAAEFGGYLPQGEPLGSYQSAEGIAIFDENGGSHIEGADFALGVVDEVERNAHHRGQLNFSN